VCLMSFTAFPKSQIVRLDLALSNIGAYLTLPAIYRGV
jgi:hypothetical protein